jgi:hypothetical protein
MVDLLYCFLGGFPHVGAENASKQLSVARSGHGRMLNFRHITLLWPHWRNSPPEALEVLVERDNRATVGADITSSACERAVAVSRPVSLQASRGSVVRDGGVRFRSLPSARSLAPFDVDSGSSFPRSNEVDR